MSEDDSKALFSMFEALCRTYTQDSPDQKLKENAWMQLVKEFIRIEMPDPLEQINAYMILKNPLLETKLAIFESKHCVLLHSTSVKNGSLIA
jgi:hypothetical protein